MNKWELLKQADKQDSECVKPEDLPEKEKDFKTAYQDFYDDIKQPTKHIKEDWQILVKFLWLYEKLKQQNKFNNRIDFKD